MRTTFDSARLPKSDRFGFFCHPDLNLFTSHAVFDHAALAREGFELNVIPLESDNPYILERYYSDSTALTKWEPTPPPGSNWSLVGRYDTEDDPIAVFVRPLSPATV